MFTPGMLMGNPVMDYWSNHWYPGEGAGGGGSVYLSHPMLE